MATKKTELPHVVQRYDWDCGIACVAMILVKFGKAFDDSALFSALPNLGIGKSVWTIDLANILRYYNINCVFYTITCGVDPGYKFEAYYSGNFDTEERRVNLLFRTASELGMTIVKRSIIIEDILLKLDNGYVAIVLVNSNLLICNTCAEKCKQNDKNDPRSFWLNLMESNKITNKYEGHYIVLCGYNADKCVIFYHNPSLKEVECCVSISSFEEARKSYGTDEDIIFVNING